MPHPIPPTMWFLGVIGPCQEQALPLHFFLLQRVLGLHVELSLDYLLPSPPSWIILASVETPSENTCNRFTSVSLVLKMAWKWLCPDRSNGTPTKKKKNQPRASAKKTPQLTTPKSSETGHQGDSAHKNKKIGLFTVESMRKCIEEVKAVEARQKEQGLNKPERSRNQICKQFGIHPSTLSNT